MKKLFYLTSVCLIVSACGNFNDKQAIDSTYYKNTQSIAWPTEQKTSATTTKAKTQVKKVADKTAETATKVAEKATTVSKTITTTTSTSETTTYTK